ncbi:hypothetical protein [Alkaliphilus sp. B6464]|uniref:hypothetical protein n=1 Tax=Alkaliphilus sp. B6464 TaxID=2731219 RepID=UPI001BA68DDF|nr:hypothetical protein [Alkaliphilus sp. B6464]QUH18464.1 hypothetical protein HYG84_00140 [Alkaliphilus sp. B6464]
MHIVDKVYNAATFNLQGLQAGNRIPFRTLPKSKCGPKSRIIDIDFIDNQGNTQTTTLR